MYTENNNDVVGTEVSETEHNDGEEEALTPRMAEDYRVLTDDSIKFDARDAASMDVSGSNMEKNKRKFGETTGYMAGDDIEGGTESCSIRETDCTTHIESVKKRKGPVSTYDGKNNKSDRRRQISSLKGKVAMLNKASRYRHSMMELDAVLGMFCLSRVRGLRVLQRREQVSSSHMLPTFPN